MKRITLAGIGRGNDSITVTVRLFGNRAAHLYGRILFERRRNHGRADRLYRDHASLTDFRHAGITAGKIKIGGRKLCPAIAPLPIAVAHDIRLAVHD